MICAGVSDERERERTRKRGIPSSQTSVQPRRHCEQKYRKVIQNYGKFLFNELSEIYDMYRNCFEKVYDVLEFEKHEYHLPRVTTF